MIEAEALALAIEALVERAVARRIDEKLGRGAPAASSGPMPVPLAEAERVTGIKVAMLRKWIAAGRLPHRNLGTGAKRATYGVLLDEVRAAAAGGGAAEPEAKPIEIEKAAARLRARTEKRGG